VLFGLVCALSSAVLAQARPRNQGSGSQRLARDSAQAVGPGVRPIAGSAIDVSGVVIVGAKVTVTGTHIVEKLGASDRIHAVTLAVRRGLLHV
jgi:hypothetical protein